MYGYNSIVEHWKKTRKYDIRTPNKEKGECCFKKCQLKIPNDNITKQPDDKLVK